MVGYQFRLTRAERRARACDVALCCVWVCGCGLCLLCASYVSFEIFIMYRLCSLFEWLMFPFLDFIYLSLLPSYVYVPLS